MLGLTACAAAHLEAFGAHVHIAFILICMEEVDVFAFVFFKWLGGFDGTKTNFHEAYAPRERIGDA